MALTPLASNFPTQVAGDQIVQPGQLRYLPHAEGGPTHHFQDIPRHIGKQRLDGCLGTCIRIAQLDSLGSLGAAVRLKPKGHPADSLEKLEWVPEDWMHGSVVPEALRAHGQPWLLYTKAGHARIGYEFWPCLGLGQVVLVHRGQVTLAAWPVQAVLDRGASLSESFNFVFNEMAPNAFNVWAKEHLKYVTMSEGDAAWIPYGWHVAAIARPTDANAASVVVQPYITETFASNCRERGAVAEALASSIEASVTSGGMWKDDGQQFIEWLRADVAVAAGAAVGQLALEDGVSGAAEIGNKDEDSARENDGDEQVSPAKWAQV